MSSTTSVSPMFIDLIETQKTKTDMISSVVSRLPGTTCRTGRGSSGSLKVSWLVTLTEAVVFVVVYFLQAQSLEHLEISNKKLKISILLSTDNTAHNEEASKELKAGHVSLENELVEACRYDCPEADEDHPNRWWNKSQPCQVDVVVDGVDDGGEEELERSSD